MNKLEVKDKLKDNKLPEGWIKVRLGNLVEIKTGKKDVNQGNPEGVYPFFTCSKKITYSDTYTFDDEALLIAGNGEVGTIHYYKGKFEAYQRTYVLTDFKIQSKFVYFFLSNFLIILLLKEKIGTTIQYIKLNHLIDLNISFPFFLPEQKKIVEILETVDETIEKTDAIIEKYKRIKQGLMQDLLTRGIDENGKIRSEETHKFKDSPLGRIPEKWEIVKVKDIGDIEGGYAFKSDSFLLDGEYQVIKIGNLYKGILDLKKNLAYLNTLNEYEEKYTLKHLEILITLTGTIGKKDYGYTVILKHPKKVIFNQRVARIRITNTQNNPIFIFYQTKIEFFLNQFFDNSKGGTGNQANVSVYDLKKIKILRPPLLEQQRIASILSQIDETIEKEQKYKEKLERIKQGLMEDLLTGKVRVLNVN